MGRGGEGLAEFAGLGAGFGGGVAEELGAALAVGVSGAEIEKGFEVGLVEEVVSKDAVAMGGVEGGRDSHALGEDGEPVGAIVELLHFRVGLVVAELAEGEGGEEGLGAARDVLALLVEGRE